MKFKKLQAVLFLSFVAFTINAQKIGIGTSTPQAKLHIVHNKANEGVLRIDNPNQAGFVGQYFYQGGEYVGHLGYVATGSSFGHPGTMQFASGGHDMAFSVGKNNFYSEKMSINTDGFVHIGDPNPNGNKFKLSVHNGNNPGLAIKHNINSDDNWEFRMISDKKLVIYKGKTRQQLGYFSYSNGSYNSTSDRSLKSNILPMTPILSSIMALQPKSYSYKNDPKNKPCLGFVAQEVEQVFPELVTPPAKDESGAKTFYTMNYSGFGVIAIKAIQEQQTLINDQQKEINNMKSEMNKIMNAIKAAKIDIKKH